jgi:hypothetical protein
MKICTTKILLLQNRTSQFCNLYHFRRVWRSLCRELAKCIVYVRLFYVCSLLNVASNMQKRPFLCLNCHFRFGFLLLKVSLLLYFVLNIWSLLLCRLCALSLNKSRMMSLDFAFNRFFMKLFKSSFILIVHVKTFSVSSYQVLYWQIGVKTS